MTHTHFLQKLLGATIVSMAFSSYACADTLKETAVYAVQHHPEVMAAQQNQYAITQQLGQSKAGYLPKLDATLGGGYERSENPFTRASGKNSVSLGRREARLSLSQMLFDGFATNMAVCQQKARVGSAEYHLNEVAQTTALKSIQAYSDVLRTQELKELSQENMRSHEAYLEQIRARAEAGKGNMADVRQAEGRLALAKANLMSAEADAQKAKAAYVTVVGKQPKDLGSISAPVDMLPASYEEALRKALDQHPAILSANEDVNASADAYRGTKAPFMPRLDAELEAAKQKNLDGQKGDNDEYLAMLRMRYNLYRGGADTARMNEASARLAQTRDEMEGDRRAVEERIFNAWENLKTAQARIEPLSLHVTSAEQTRAAYRAQFDIGQRTLLDLLDSEVELYNAKTALINGRYATDFSVYDVLAGMGDLLKALRTEDVAANAVNDTPSEPVVNTEEVKKVNPSEGVKEENLEGMDTGGSK